MTTTTETTSTRTTEPSTTTRTTSTTDSCSWWLLVVDCILGIFFPGTMEHKEYRSRWFHTIGSVFLQVAPDCSRLLHWCTVASDGSSLLGRPSVVGRRSWVVGGRFSVVPRRLTVVDRPHQSSIVGRWVLFASAAATTPLNVCQTFEFLTLAHRKSSDFLRRHKK